jgi:hypothetical protein
MVLFSVPFVGLGGLLLAQALGLAEFSDPLVPNWVLGSVGLAFLTPGLVILLYGLGVRRSGGGLLIAVGVLAFAAVFHYGAFARDWPGDDIGPFSAPELARIIVVTIDLYFLYWWIVIRTLFDGGQPGPVLRRVEGWGSTPQKVFAYGFQLVPLGIALLLHFTGVLDLIRAGFG